MRPGYDDRTPREEPTREPLVNLSGKPRQAAAPSAGPNPRRRRLSDMESEGREAPPQPEPTREPLVDLNVKTPQPPEPSAGLHLRRKRLSHTEPEGNEAPPQPPTGQQRRRSVAPRGASAEEPAPEPESSDAERRRPCLMSMVAAPEEAVAEEQEPRPKMGRARVTITQSPEDPAGLQSIIDPPRSLSEMLAPGQSEIVPPVTDRPAPQGHSGALVGGIAAALAAALVWALITMATGT
ncbi:MAG: hypothetical protein M1376_14830, partial [Planctomycetes bacterium]|nr:hypothetical protein [Planctomycetota bacterium]